MRRTRHILSALLLMSMLATLAVGALAVPTAQAQDDPTYPPSGPVIVTLGADALYVILPADFPPGSPVTVTDDGGQVVFQGSAPATGSAIEIRDRSALTGEFVTVQAVRSADGRTLTAVVRTIVLSTSASVPRIASLTAPSPQNTFSPIGIAAAVTLTMGGLALARHRKN